MDNRPGASGYGSSSTAEQVAADWDGKDKVVIITGASAGLGLESARIMAARGAHIIMAVRDMDKATQRADVIRKQNAHAQLTLLKLDLTSMESVKSFVEAFRALRLPLHILMLNAVCCCCVANRASCMGIPKQRTREHMTRCIS